MAEIVPFKSKAAKAAVAIMARDHAACMQMADIATDVRRECVEREQEAALIQLERAFRNLYGLMDPEVARTRAQFVHTKVDLDYGVGARIL